MNVQMMDLILEQIHEILYEAMVLKFMGKKDVMMGILNRMMGVTGAVIMKQGGTVQEAIFITLILVLLLEVMVRRLVHMKIVTTAIIMMAMAEIVNVWWKLDMRVLMVILGQQLILENRCVEMVLKLLMLNHEKMGIRQTVMDVHMIVIMSMAGAEQEEVYIILILVKLFEEMAGKLIHMRIVMMQIIMIMMVDHHFESLKQAISAQVEM